MFRFENTISLADIVNGLLLIVAVIGIFLTLYQIKQSNKTQRASFFKELYSMMYGDSDVTQGYYLIDHGEFKYSDSFHRSQHEKPIDRILTFMDLICYLRKEDLIAEQEIGFFEYELTRVCDNQEIQKYLAVVRKSYGDFECKTPPFPNFVWYCEKRRQDAGAA
jgi:hypothetical protein